MAIDSTCQTCGKQLRVANEHAGEQARCPNCQTVYTVPLPGRGAPLAALLPAGNLQDSWQLKTPEGLVFGPVAKEELDQWCRQGRITPRCQLLQAGQPQWQWGTEVYPELREAAAMTPIGPSLALNPYSPLALSPVPAYYPKAHRGVLVLVLALLGYITLCFLVSIFAVVLGLFDLADMKAGRMDPEGRTITIIGIVLALLWIAGNFLYIGFWILVEMGVL
jgi:phage FluMu protein Com